MITLNDRIVFTLPQQSPIPDTGIYNYVLQELDDYSAEYKTIFVGNFYYGGTGAKEFDCTDIIRSRKEIVTPYTKYSSQDKIYSTPTEPGEEPVLMETIDYLKQKLVKRYRIGVYLSPSTPTYTNIVSVAMVYPYTNLGQLTNPENVIFDGYNSSIYFIVANQGFRDSTRRMELIPHYPLKNTTKYNYMQSLYIGQGTQDCWLRKVTDDGKSGIYGDYLRLIQQQYDITSITFKQPLGEFIKGEYGDYYSATAEVRLSDISVYQRGIDSTDTTNQIKVAIIDNCNARYYLQWQDRLGGFQSQALKDNITYTETFTNEQVQSYTNAKRNSTVGVQPKWKLYTGWIEEKIFPIYESILVSPYLVLYDTLYDKSYNVICTGEWEEKTYKNQKKLLNLTFNFEADTMQNMIY